MIDINKLDDILNQLPDNGSIIGVDDGLFARMESGFEEDQRSLNYLKAKGLIYTSDAMEGIVAFGLTDEGIIFKNDGGFAAQNEKEESKKKEESKQIKKERRIKIWIPIICSILSAALSAYLTYLVTHK